MNAQHGSSMSSSDDSSSSFYGLFWASVGMFFGCYIAGLVPLSLSLSESRIKTMSVFGSGLLIGTALSVIIPEGLHMVIEHDAMQQGGSHSYIHRHAPNILEGVNPRSHSSSNTQNVFPIPNDLLPDNIISNSNSKTPGNEAKARKQGPMPKADQLMNGKRDETLDTGEGHDHSDQTGQAGHDDDEDHEGASANVIGLSLVTGFVFMLIIDHVAAGSHSHSHPHHPGTPHSQYTQGLAHQTDAENTMKTEMGTNSRSRTKLTTTLGLLIHAAADGIAMAAVSTTQKSDLQLLVFVAIMLHKFPASFGLVSFLLSEKVDKVRVRRHLMAFSLAAPLGALATYLLMASLGVSSASTSGGSGLFTNFSGKALLFSGGTFLYVATIHILPNIQLSSPGGHFSSWHVSVLVMGAFFPALLNVFHHH